MFIFNYLLRTPLSIKTIKKCKNLLKKTKIYDSILTSHEIYSWFWFNKKPVNYKPKILPRSQDAKPVVVETTGLYGIKSSALKNIIVELENPYFFNVNKKEALDLDNIEDFEILKNLQIIMKILILADQDFWEKI